MLYILIGEDDYSIRQFLEELKRGIGDQTLLATNTTTFDGQQVTPDQLRSICDTVPFLSEKRLVIITGLLERFEPKTGSSRKKKTAQISSRKNDSQILGTFIREIPDSTVLILIDGKVKGNNPMLREVSAKAKVKSFPPLRDADLRRWIQRRVTEEGGSISPQAVTALVRLVGSNLWIMSSEINKLVMFTSGRRIEEDDIKTVVSYAQQTNVYAMIDAIHDCKAEAAQLLLQQLLQRGVAPSYILVVLSRQFQTIARAKELIGQKKPLTEIQSKLGLPSEYALRKTLEQAGKYPRERLIEIYHRLLEADLSIKTGKYEGDLAFNILVAELCQQHRK